MLAAALESSDSILYRVDADLRILTVSDGYRRFAEHNAPLGFLARWGEGCDVLGAIDDPQRDFYHRMYRHALEGHIAENDYECHGLRRWRLFRMRIISLEPGEGCLVEHAQIIDRELVGALDLDPEEIRDRYQDEFGVIMQCASCRKTHLARGWDRWDWVSDLVAQPWPNVRYRTCPTCIAHLRAPLR
ncbi:MAG TPA: hypothetical protein DCS97_01595 [Planctomycetes bacterium]|nr:hypothetical protein [Planctomycetota bacterium]